MHKILVIDDDETMNECFMDCFDPDEFLVEIKRTGKEGKQAFEKNRPDFVVLDLGLPDIDGIEILKQIKSIDPNVPIGVLSGYASRRDESMELDAHSFKIKPLTIDEFEEWFKEVLGQ